MFRFLLDSIVVPASVPDRSTVWNSADSSISTIHILHTLWLIFSSPESKRRDEQCERETRLTFGAKAFDVLFTNQAGNLPSQGKNHWAWSEEKRMGEQPTSGITLCHVIECTRWTSSWSNQISSEIGYSSDEVFPWRFTLEKQRNHSHWSTNEWEISTNEMINRMINDHFLLVLAQI